MNWNKTIRLFTVALLFWSLMQAKAFSLDPNKKGNLILGGVVVLFNERNIEKLIFSPYADRVLRFYDQRLKVIAGEDPYYPDDGEIWAKANFDEKFYQLLLRSDVVDLFIFGHANNSHQFLLNRIPPELRTKIRLVYNSGCEDGKDVKLTEWLRLGVKVAVGHPHPSVSQSFAPGFIGYWLMGNDVHHSVEYANEALVTNPALLLNGAGARTVANWNGEGSVNIYSKP